MNPLASEIAEYYDDPLGYVLDLFPWGQGELRTGPQGPDKWHREELERIGREVKARKFNGTDPVTPLRLAVSSGHDTGKTTLAAWLANWIKDTRPYSQGTVTANTFSQLETKTYSAIKRWAKLLPTRDWWEIGATQMYHKEARDSWFLACQSSGEDNSESFAGQHAATSTSWYLLDEASAIADVIWDVAEGGLRDGEPMIFAFGNPTRNTGRFHDVCFGNRRHRWLSRVVDSREAAISNKAEIDNDLADYGEDSDYFRVRVRGLPPNTSEQQLIGRTLVQSARHRSVKPLEDDPLIAGVDVPDGGSAWFIVRFRRGLDGHPAAAIRMPGSRVDRPAMIATLAKLCREGVACLDGRRYPIAAMFVDSAFGSPIVERLHTLGYDQVNEVNFGGKSPDPHYANMRSYMWAKGAKEWLDRGALSKDDTKLEIDLTGPGFHLNKSNAMVLESKEEMRKRGVPSPDDGDAFALTFASPVAPITREEPEYPVSGKYGSSGWMR